MLLAMGGSDTDNQINKTKTKINTNCQHEIHKISDRVVQIGKIENGLNLIKPLCEILDHGFKFVPCWHTSVYDIFINTLFNLDNLLLRFNSRFCFKKLNNNKVDKNYSILSNSLVPSDELNTNINNILDSLKAKNRVEPKNLPIQHEIINLRFNMLSKIKHHKFKIEQNLSQKQLNTLKSFKLKKPFLVVELDKNIGSAIISYNLYDQLVYEHLNNTNIYEELNSNPLNNTIDKIKKVLNGLTLSKKLCSKLFKQLNVKNPKLGSFRILPKIHKYKFGIRPIVNCRNHPTSNMALFIELLLREHVKASDSYLKDSQDLLNTCENLKIPEDSIIYVGDFESLYTNIPSQKCIDTICDFMKDKLHNNLIEIEAFNEILKLVFFNNVFKYKNNFYIQISGISMGIICGPTLANMFLNLLESHWLYIEKPIFYKRYIDDVILVSKKNLNTVFFKSFFGNLNIEFSSGDVIDFLDLKIRINKILNRLEFDLFIKPTSTNNYLNTTSNHPTTIMKNIPKSIFIRYRRICTNLVDYFYHSRQLIKQLCDKGYNKRAIVKTCRIIASIDRIKLLKYKPKINKMKNKVPLSLFYDKNLDIKNEIKPLLKDLEVADNYKTSYQTIPLIQPNVKTITVFNGNLPYKHFKTNKKCGKKNCITCPYLLTEKYYLHYSFSLPILQIGTCISQSAIYCIVCTKCNTSYIGETRRTVKTRIQEHINSIKNYKLFKKRPTEVALHFNQEDHDYTKDMKFAILRIDIENMTKRKSYENDLINIFIALNFKLMNNIKMNRNFISHFYFENVSRKF
jgi:hypothetical protein